jgi:dTDP-L-rhamnose 4-epimerase
MGYLGASRDFIYVKDVALAFGLAVTAAPPGFHALNIGTGQPVPIRRVVQLLQDLLGDSRPVHEDTAAFRKFDRRSLTPRVEAVERVLGWKARTPFREGLENTITDPVGGRSEEVA